MTHIRDATTTDAEDLASLLEDLGYPTAAPEVVARLAAVEGGGGRTLVLDDGGRILGLASVTRCVMLHRRRPVAILTALVVRGEVRGRGLGRRLVAEVETVAREWNCETVELTSRYGRRDAHDFYRSLGFESHSRKFAREVTTCSDAIRS